MQCTNPIRLIKGLNFDKYPDGLEVPCGKCLACRITKRREWSMRLLHELEFHTDSTFITLTYSDDFIPAHNSLVKADLQKFFKRLRKSLVDHKIKYFASGEYGDITQRPHYHAVIFGLGLWPEHKLLIKRAWNRGLVHHGTATATSIEYVCGYIDKKFSGALEEEVYKDTNRENVFKLSSNGLGRRYAELYKDKIVNNKRITVRGVPCSIPRYYLNVMDVSSELVKDNAVKSDLDRSERLIHQRIGRDEAYHQLTAGEVLALEQAINDERKSKSVVADARRNLFKRHKI